KGEPGSLWTAPRAWGEPLLLAPIARFTAAFFPIRIYITALSGLLMYLAFRPWLKVFAKIGGWYTYVPPIAASLLASLWLTILYRSMAYPNLWLMFTLVAGVGYFFLALEADVTWKSLAPVVAAFAVASMLRPTDALAAAMPLALILVARRGRAVVQPLVAV